MQNIQVKELMLPLSEYAVVSPDATLHEALRTLAEAQDKLPDDKPYHRAVLVTDDQGRIVGKLGQIGFLQALEPKYAVLGDVERLARAGLSDEFVNSIMDHYRFWQDNMDDVCRRARTIRIGQVMKPVEVSIDESRSLTEAIHLLVMWHTNSLLVTRDDDVIGILRMSDLFRSVADAVTSDDCSEV